MTDDKNPHEDNLADMIGVGSNAYVIHLRTLLKSSRTELIRTLEDLRIDVNHCLNLAQSNGILYRVYDLPAKGTAACALEAEVQALMGALSEYQGLRRRGDIPDGKTQK